MDNWDAGMPPPRLSFSNDSIVNHVSRFKDITKGLMNGNNICTLVPRRDSYLLLRSFCNNFLLRDSYRCMLRYLLMIYLICWAIFMLLLLNSVLLYLKVVKQFFFVYKRLRAGRDPSTSKYETCTPKNEKTGYSRTDKEEGAYSCFAAVIEEEDEDSELGQGETDNELTREEGEDSESEQGETDNELVRKEDEDSESEQGEMDNGLKRKQGPQLWFEEEEEDFIPGEDTLLICEGSSEEDIKIARCFTMYKTVDRKVKPVSGTFPQEARVIRKFPHDPLEGLRELPTHPPEFSPSEKISWERLKLLNINGEGFLWLEEERLFQQVMLFNEEALAFEETDRGTLREDYFSPYIMPTIPHIPWEQRNIPIPAGIKDQVIELLKHKMDAGVYEHCQSAYRSRWFCVLKKNGKLRLVHDLQTLNSISIRDAGVPPVLDDFVEDFAGRSCYTVYDLFWGFDARKVDPASRDLTAFMTPLGLLRLTAMPMGYTNSPAEFQKCMVFIMRDEIPTVANVFIDDLPIKGPSHTYLDAEGKPETLAENPGIRRFIWEHAVDVNRCMHRIKQAGATFSATKTQICRPEVLILGQKCTPEGRRPDDAKIEKILKWPLPKDVSQVRGFLGLCGTVRIWIAGYSKLNRRLTELYRAEHFEWTPERIAAFEELKKAVTRAPALRPIDYKSELPVILAVDTSMEAVGIVLLQIDEKGKRRPARYGSLPLTAVEGRYSQPKLELFGLYKALRAFRLYLIGIKNLVVEVDAQYIKGMLSAPDLQPNAAMNRWIQGILLFDFVLKHVPGTTHLAADALSRRALAEDEHRPEEESDDEWLDEIALLVKGEDSQDPEKTLAFASRREEENHRYPKEILPSLVLVANTKWEKELDQIFRFLTTLEAPSLGSTQDQNRFLDKTKKYIIKNNQLWKKRSQGMPLLVIRDLKRRMDILKEAHENLGHRGEQPVFETIRLRYYWPHLRADVKHHVRSCHPCQVRNTAKMKIPPTVSTPTTIFVKIYVDVMDMPESRRGHKYIVCARDDLSRACEARPLRKNDSVSLAKFFWEQIYCRYGAIAEVVTDNGPELKAAFAALLKRLNIPQVRISAYNKQANGVVERGHFIIREAILKSVEKVKNWADKVQLAVFADRVTVSRSTGYSPYYLIHGMHPVLPLDLFDATFLVEGYRSGMDSAELLALRMRHLERRPEDLSRAAEALRKARFTSKEEYEWRYRRRLRKEHYKPGELVMVRNTEVETHLNRKSKPRYLGPYEVVRRTKGGSYVLKEMDGTPLREGVAAYRLLPYISRYSKHMLRKLAEEAMEEDETSSDDETSDTSSDGNFEDSEEE